MCVRCSHVQVLLILLLVRDESPSRMPCYRAAIHTTSLNALLTSSVSVCFAVGKHEVRSSPPARDDEEGGEDSLSARGCALKPVQFDVVDEGCAERRRILVRWAKSRWWGKEEERWAIAPSRPAPLRSNDDDDDRPSSDVDDWVGVLSCKWTFEDVYIDFM